MGPSQNGTVWKLDLVGIRLLGWLVNDSSLPDIPMYFLHENRLSWFEFHTILGGSTRLTFDEFLANPGTFHRLPNAGRDLGK